MRTRHDVLDDVLHLQCEIEEREEEINKLCNEARGIKDEEDDEDMKKNRCGYLDSILSHETF